ncbi:MAG: toprim domain-containing protein, partial [Eubacteriales bacterium]|nr:toprim domain-containing protein [Eubacteriales bacterium]NLV70750.1 toprim domain-containing protein [Clostridiales bacterium]
MNDRERPTIKQVIVVEGRDDEAAVLRAVQATTIATHGYGIRGETLELIGKAYREQGIILFTDPDHAGREIRRRLTRLFPGAGQAYLTVEEAEKNGDIGIENADAASIRSALDAAGAARKEAFA